MLNPAAPNPSVEAILHAVLPHRFVDHTHADAVVTLSNTPDGAARIRALYGDRVIVVPYVMPGFVLARAVYEQIRGIEDWSAIEGMVLLHHGLFTFADDARESYERTIRLVSEAERELERRGAPRGVRIADAQECSELRTLAEVRALVSAQAGRAMIARFDGSPEACGLASREDVDELVTRGPVTPDHVIRMKRAPVVIGEGDGPSAIDAYASAYRAYFARNDDGTRTCLDPAPRWAVWKGRGVIAFGASASAAQEVIDIARHSARCFQWGEAMGGWRPLGEGELFAMEYWELEQAKLKKPGAPPALAGKIALVTGGATGIGAATVRALRKAGAAVCALDVRPAVEELRGADVLGVACDVTDGAAVERAVAQCVRVFGGLDVLVLNAGSFPPSARIEAIDEERWRRTFEVNVDGAMHTLRAAAPYLERGIEPSVVVIASRNVPAPGPGAAAYSASKAALTQLARVAALELGPKGVRVNVLHPDKVFDTELWTEETIALRAKSYGLSVEQYKKSNLLGVEVASADVAELVVALSTRLFRATTGAQIPIDGGSDRVI
jgi:rhamnose utilization protein RhaD (predicted bifunctional aldolase and dehydrogenase)/NAD(P)-dependent dehydrogenase (short-subunit alcohol dehydrogenase family)